MRKIYLLSLLLVLISFSGLAQSTWYTTPAGADVTNLNNWWSTSGGSGTHPGSFTNSGDQWIVQGACSMSVAWTLGNSTPAASYSTLLQLNTGSYILTGGTFNITLYCNLSLLGTSYLNSSTGSPNYYFYGNVSFAGTSYITNSPAYNYCYWANTSSTYASPQTITITSTSFTSGNWTYWYVNAGVSVQMNSNFSNQGYPWSVSGTMNCQTYSQTGTGAFTLNAGGTLWTGLGTGINGAILTSSYTFPTTASYGFNGTVTQVTGTFMPTTVAGLYINNTSGGSPAVTLTSSATVSAGGTVNLWAGILRTTTTTLTQSAGLWTLNVDQGSFSAAPVNYNLNTSYPVNLNYVNAATTPGNYTTGFEFPATFYGNVTVNKPGYTVTHSTMQKHCNYWQPMVAFP